MPDISEYTPYNGTNLCSDIDVVINQVRQALTDEAGTVFATLKARLDLTEGKAVSGAFNLTGSNVAEVCSNDADNLPNNRIYGVSISSSTTVSHFPAKNGQMITFGTGATRSASGDFQVFFENNGTIHYRSIWNGTWSSWKTVADGGKAVSGAFNLTGSNVAEICDSNADNLPNNRIYGVSIVSSVMVSNFPAKSGQMITFGTGATRSASGDSQIFFENAGKVFYRSVWNGTWSEWKRLDNLNVVSGAGNITGSNVAEICDSDADNVPNNRIYGVSIASSVTVSNFPARSGQMITFGTGPVRSNSGDSQIFIQNTGEFYYRSIWNGTWSSWKTVGQIATFGTGSERSASGDFQVFFKNDGSLYYRTIWNGTWSEWIRTGGYWAVAGMGNITGSNIASICSNDANNLPNNRIYGVSIASSVEATNFPARSGQMITFGCANVRSNSGDSQIFIQNTRILEPFITDPTGTESGPHGIRCLSRNP